MAAWRDFAHAWKRGICYATPRGPRPHPACLVLAPLAPGNADPAPAIHYAPVENLGHIDVALIDRAEHEIDMAAYVLTDWPILQALTRAADRGVKVRIYLDGTQLAEREPAKAFNDLAETPGVEIRIKHKTSAPMHLKSYQIDGRLLRTGAANFSGSGLDGLETILFDQEWKARLKERSQLHRILADNTWLFGEEFALTVDDKSLTEVLRKHAKLKKLDLVIDEPVKRLDGTKGIVDLMLSRSIPGPRAEELDHLIIELKAPKVKIGSDETTQIQSYAFAVIDDERFRDLNTRWTFWLVSNDMDDFARRQVRSANRPEGLLWQSDDSRNTIWVRTWSQILTDSRARLRVFQKELNYSADQDASVEFLKESYARILSGDSEQTDSCEPEGSNEETFDLIDAVPTPAARP